MSHIHFFKSKPSWTNIPFKFGSFSSEIFTHKGYLVDFPFPSLSLSLSWFHHGKHLALRQSLHLLNWNRPFSSLFLSLLFQHVGQHLSWSRLLSVQQISRHCTLFNIILFNFHFFFFMGFNDFFHFNLFLKPFLIVQFRFQSLQVLSLLGQFVWFSGDFFSDKLLLIFSLSKSFFVKFNIVVLRH